MNKFKLALASLAVAGAAVVATPEPAKAGGFAFSVGFGHPGWHGGYYPAHYGWGYHRPFYRKKIVIVHRPYYPVVYHRPFVRKVFVHRPTTRWFTTGHL